MTEHFRCGDVVQLPHNLGEIDAGLWAVTAIGWLITLTRVGENEDGDRAT